MRDVELVAICLVKNREDFRTVVTQCSQCGHHRYVPIDQAVDIEIGEKL